MLLAAVLACIAPVACGDGDGNGNGNGSGSGNGKGDDGEARRMELPPAGAAFDYQLGGDGPLPEGVTVVARDWQGGTPAGGAVYDICYVNAFQSQPDVEWPAEVVSDAEDPEWPGEFAIDLSTPGNRGLAAAAVERMIEQCAAQSFDAVEFDNLDTFTRFPQLGFGRAEAVEYATTLVGLAHVRGLAAGQKNSVELLGQPIGFDFAVVEQCGEYDECEAFADAFGSLVFAIEYTDEGLAAACASLGDDASVIRRDLGLSPLGAEDHVYETCRSSLALGG